MRFNEKKRIRAIVEKIDYLQKEFYCCMEQLEHNEKEIEYIRFFTMRLYMIESILRNQYREILNKYIKLYFSEDLKDVKLIFESI